MSLSIGTSFVENAQSIYDLPPDAQRDIGRWSSAIQLADPNLNGPRHHP